MAKVIVVGGGRMGARHIDAAILSGHDLLALVDPNPDCFAVESKPELSRLRVSSLKEVEGGDVAIIATAADHHISLLLNGIDAGIRRFVVEKPFAQSLADSRVAEQAAEASGARVVVNHGRRYDPNTNRLKAMDKDGSYGRLRSVFLRMGGGGFGCVGTHWIDLCNNLMGEKPKRVFAMTTSPSGNNPRGSKFFDPGVSTILLYSDERRAIIDIGDDVGIIGGGEFVFEMAQISWVNEGGNWSFRHRSQADLSQPRSRYGLPLVEEKIEPASLDATKAAQAALADALSDGPIVSGIAEALDTMEVFVACRLSASTSAAVSLPIGDADAAQAYPIP